MSFSIDIKTNAVLIGISQFDDVCPFEIDHLGAEILNSRFFVVDHKAQHIIQAGLEPLLKLLDLAWSLLDWIFLSFNLHTLLAAVDRDGFEFRAAKLRPFHIGKFDVVRKSI